MQQHLRQGWGDLQLVAKFLNRLVEQSFDFLHVEALVREVLRIGVLRVYLLDITIF